MTSPNNSTAERPFPTWAVPALVPVLMLCLAVFWPVTTYHFSSYDDDVQVQENPMIRSLGFRNVVHMFTGYSVTSYYPIRLLSLALDYRFSQLDPRGYHRTNLLIHLANVVAVYLLFLRLLRQPACGAHSASPTRSHTMLCALAAAAFGVHPIVVEPVAWIPGREELLMSFFAVLCLHAHLSLRNAAPGTPRRRMALLHAARFVACMFSCMSNVIGAVIPFLLLAFDMLDADRQRKLGRLKTHIKRSFPLWLLAAVFLYIKMANPSSPEPIIGRSAILELTFKQRILTILDCYGHNVSVLFVPRNLVTPYVNVVPGSFGAPGVLKGLFLALGTAALLVWARNRKRVLLGLCWFLLALAPASSIIPHHMFKADRFLYLPLVGFLLAAVCAFLSIPRKPILQRAILIVALLLVATLSVAAAVQRRAWQSGLTLFAHALALDNTNYVAHSSLATVMLQTGRNDEALVHLRRSLAINPMYGRAHYNIGCVLSDTGRRDEAISHYSEAIRYMPGDPDVYNNLGIALAERGELEEAAGHYRTVIRNAPGHVTSYVNLGADLVNLGRYEEAIKTLRTALELQPMHIEAHNNLGAAFDKLGRTHEALHHFLQALALNPDMPMPHYNCGFIYANAGDTDAALYHLRRVVQLAPNDPIGESALNLIRDLKIERARRKRAALTSPARSTGSFAR